MTANFPQKTKILNKLIQSPFFISSMLLSTVRTLVLLFISQSFI